MPSTLPNAAEAPATAPSGSDRLAWLFRTGQADGNAHPLLAPVAELRGDAGALAGMPTAPGMPVWVPAEPRHSVDRAWLCRQVAALPPLPRALTEAARVVADAGSTTAACAEVLGRDPALSAQLLRLANAAAHGRAGQVGSLHDAVLLLGRQKLGALLAAAAVVAQFDQAACPGFDVQRFWRQSFACALAAQALAADLGADEGLAFTTGLLHDLGQLVLAVHMPAAAAQALAWARLHDLPLHDAERDVLGIDHAEVGALLAGHWNLPGALVAAIGSHHGPAQPPAPGGRPRLADLLQVADAMAHALDLDQAAEERVPALCPQLARRLRLTPERCLRTLAATQVGVAVIGF